MRRPFLRAVPVIALCALAIAGCSDDADDDGFASPDEDVTDDTTSTDTGVADDATPDAAPDTAPDTAPSCGDGARDDGEACDGDDHGGETCVNLGFDGGELTCTTACELDDSGCVVLETPECGNDVREDDEECDGDDLPATCEDGGFDAGAASCANDCTVDYSGCTSLVGCGDGSTEGDEECDDGNLEDDDGCSSTCQVEECGDGTVQAGIGEECEDGVVFETCDGLGALPLGVVRCEPDCTWGDAVCPDPVCGDGALDAGEACDDGNTDDGDGCDGSCDSETCGDDTLDPAEACDGADLGSFTCADFGFGLGDLACVDCAIDYSGCRFATCGDGVIEGLEDCDDGNREDGDGCSRTCRDEGGGGCLDVQIGCRLSGTMDPLSDDLVVGALAMIECAVASTMGGDGDAIATHDWAFASVPTDAYAMFSTPTQPTATAFLDLVGDYEVTLDVTDESGDPACMAAAAQVQVIPERQLLLQLTWDTPGDPDPLDTGAGVGADLDIHLVHPSGDWFDAMFECSWRSPNPNWGNPDGAVDDNPSLDRDDTDGAGPENISLNMAEPGVYRVGVHFWDDHGFGDSTATLRVYVDGSLVYEGSQVLTTAMRFWEPITLTFPAGTFEVVDMLSAEIPNRP